MAGHAAEPLVASRLEVRRKRVFREVQSDSDGKADSDSEEESRPILAAVGMSSGSKVDRRSSSSDSLPSPEREFPSRSALYDTDSSSDDEKPTKPTELPSEKSSSSENDASSSDSDASDKQETDRTKISDTKQTSQRPVTAQADASRSGSRVKQSEKEAAGKEKSSDQQTEAQDRIRAKLIAISELSVDDVKKSQPSQSRDLRTSGGRARSPSPPKRYTHSYDQRRSSHHNRPAPRRSRSRSHSGSGRRHRHDRSRSRSTDSAYRHHRDHRHRDRHSQRHGRHRSRDRRRSPSTSPTKPKSFKEQLKEKLLSTAQQSTTAAATVTSSTAGLTATATATSATGTASAAALEARKLLTAKEKRGNLPLNANNPLVAMMSGNKDLKAAQMALIAQSMTQKVTPQQALSQAMAAMHEKAQQMTGVAVPSYYNPAAVNPLKFAEQLKKRKMLWSKAPKETGDKEKEPTDSKTVQSVAQWTGTSFAADEDGKVAAKFRKLMGIREEDQALLDDNVDLSKLTEEQRRRQEELFAQLDKEYAFARMTTHTCRGLGLGFQSQGMPDT